MLSLIARRGIVSKRIPHDQSTLTGVDVIEARKQYSLSTIPNLDVYCIFCFHIDKLLSFAQIDVMGELERFWKCPECHIQMTRKTLMTSFTPEYLGYYIGTYEKFWSRVSAHDKWMERFKHMFSYQDRMIFWNAYYKVRPKKEQTVGDNV